MDRNGISEQQKPGPYRRIWLLMTCACLLMLSQPVPAHAQTGYFLYDTLPGHEGGVNSLSFGPDDGRYNNGGLRLASGGARDGLVKLWNLGTGEFYGDKDMKQGLPPDDAAVQVLFNPRVREDKRVELQAGAISVFRFLIRLSDMTFSSAGTSGGGYHMSLDGIAGIMTFAANTKYVAVSEISDSGTTTVHIRHGSSISSLEAPSKITALAFDPTAEFLAVAAAVPGKQGILKLIQVKDTRELWQVNLPFIPETLAFQPHGNRLAAGGKNGPGVSLYTVEDGSLIQGVSDRGGRGIISLAFSHDGHYLAGCGPDSHRVSIWRANGALMEEHVVDTLGPVTALALNHDGRLLVTGHQESPDIRIWGKGNALKKGGKK